MMQHSGSDIYLFWKYINVGWQEEIKQLADLALVANILSDSGLLRTYIDAMESLLKYSIEN